MHPGTAAAVTDVRPSGRDRNGAALEACVSSGFFGRVGPGACDKRAVQQQGGDPIETVESVFDAEWATIDAGLREAERFSLARDAEAGLVAAVIGTLVDVVASPPRLVSAADLLTRLRARSRLELADFEGTYQIVIAREREREVTISSDHLSSRPLFHTYEGGLATFGRSETEVVLLTAREPRLCLDGAIGLLAVGFPLGERTLTEGIERLRPARELVLQVDRRPHQRTWWDLSFANVTTSHVGVAAEELHARAQISQLATTIDGAPLHLALTGGMDSRLILGLMRETGRLPASTFTWGQRRDVPGSYLEIAQQLAQVAGTDHSTLTYQPDDFAEHLDEWLWISALRSDNLGHFCAGPSFLERCGVPVGPVLLGDHALGVGGRYGSRDNRSAPSFVCPGQSYRLRFARG